MKRSKKRKASLSSEKTHERKKLLMGITLSEVGGSQRVVCDLIANLLENEFDVTLVTSPGGELIKWINDLNNFRVHKVKIITLTSLKREISLLHDLRAFFELYRIIFKGQYDIVHFHNSKIGILGRIAAWAAGVPGIFYTAHGWGIKAAKSKFQLKILNLLEKLAGRLSTMVICVSKNDMNECIRNRWAKNGKVCVINNGISEIPKVNRELHNELQIPENMPVIASVARLSTPKDPLFSIRAANDLIRSGCDFTLLLIGDGPLRKDCEILINDLGIEKSVLMLGEKLDVRSLLEGVDIVVLFSKWEGLPIAVIEAMFAGKPVIASNVGGVSELIRHGENGYLLDNLDISQATEYIRKLIDDKNLREMMGRSGKEIAQRGFKLEEMIRKYQSIYKET